jgi:FKBP-type peptidyl-prolyl cis-trans isomerase
MKQSKVGEKSSPLALRASTITTVISLVVALVSITLVIIIFIANNQHNLVTEYNNAYSEYAKANEAFETRAMQTLEKIDTNIKTSKQYRRNIYYRDCFKDTNFFDEPYTNPELARIEDFDNVTDESLTNKITILNNATDTLKQFTETVNDCEESFSQTQEQIDSKLQERFSFLYEREYQTKQKQQSEELSNKYFKSFSKYKTYTSTFDNEVQNLQTKDIKVGNGKIIKYSRNGGDVDYDTSYAAYYIGWLSNGVIFDSSYDDNDKPASLQSPINGSSAMIQGWLDGIEGMKIGGIREITIPAPMGYGDVEQGNIPAGSTLKFIVMLIEKPKAITISDELEDLGVDLYGFSIRGNY